MGIKENKISTILYSIFIGIFLIAILIVGYMIYKVNIISQTVYDIDTYYYTEKGTEITLTDIKIGEIDNEGYVELQGGGIKPLGKVEIRYVTRPQVYLGGTNIFYLYSNYGVKIREIGIEDTMLTKAGIQEGDFIQRIQNELIDDETELYAIVEQYKDYNGLYTIYERDNRLYSVHLNPNDILDCKVEGKGIFKKTVSFMTEDSVYTQGKIGYSKWDTTYMGLRGYNITQAHKGIDNYNCNDIVTEKVKETASKLVEETSNYVIFEKRGQWKYKEQIEIGFAWEIDIKKPVTLKYTNAESGLVEEMTLMLESNRYEENGIKVHRLNLKDVELTEDMIGAPIIQNNRLVGVLSDVKKGNVTAADLIYFAQNK